MRKLLAIGNSHLNSLKLSEAYARDKLQIAPQFAYSSSEAWCSIPTCSVDGGIQFVRDPKEYFGRHSPVPSFVRQLPSGLRLDAFDEVVVGNVGTTVGGLWFFTQNRLPGTTAHPWRNPVTRDLFNEVVDIANGIHPPHRVLSWSSLPHNSDYCFSLRRLLAQVAAIAGGAKLTYLPHHPPLPAPDADAEQIALRKLAWCEYMLVVRDICEEHGFRMIQSPAETLDPSGFFIDPRFSINAAARDLHLTEEYGRILWGHLAASGS